VGRAALLVKSYADEGTAFVSSGVREEQLGDAYDLIGRAATFRIEADQLRARARETDEPAIREEYLALANRWATFAAGLEAQMFARLT
jgi:hypothetical protein